MLKQNVINFTYPFKELPIIEVNLNSTASGDIVVNDSNIEEQTALTATVYKVSPPDSSSANWVRIGNDLYTASVLYLASRKRSDGLMVVEWSFDPSSISNIADGHFYGAAIKLNAGADASSRQAGMELIFKINDNISGS